MESGKNAGNHSPEGKKSMLIAVERLWKMLERDEIIAVQRKMEEKTMINQKMIEDEIAFLCRTRESIEDQLEKLKKKVPAGSKLRAAPHRNSVQFFVRKSGKEKCGEYIKKKDRQFAECLAQIEYDELLLELIENEFSELSQLHSIPSNDPFYDAYGLIHPLKRELIKMPYISDEEFYLQWHSQEYEKLSFKENAPEFYTKRGLRVRSKTEIIIAEILDKYEIPYLYEKPLTFSNGQTIHPDFTILDIKKRREIIWEHFGMMDDIEYRNNAFLKIREYESNGYFQGVNFVWTMETSKYPINTKAINNMVQSMFEI